MNKEHIEATLKLKPKLELDPYRDVITSILTPPPWYRPLKRLQFYQEHETRIALVMAEYAGDLVNAFAGQNNQTGQEKTNQGTPVSPAS